MKSRGFTLIELLIVVAIIAILAAIAVPNFLEAQTRARVSRTQNDLRSVAIAMESYRVDNNSYPHWTVVDGNYFDRGTITGTFPTSLQYTKSCYDAPWMNLLTTPVAYTSAMPPDIFRMIAGSSNGAYRVYSVGYYSVATALGYERHFKLYPRTGWMTWSWGPDQTNNSNYATQKAVENNEKSAAPKIGTNKEGKAIPGTGTGAAIGMRYDPTNGTVSYGDIYKWAGDSIDHER